MIWQREEKSPQLKKMDLSDAIDMSRQKMLSNEKVKYVYAAGDNVIHDKSCDYVKKIPTKNLCTSTDCRN